MRQCTPQSFLKLLVIALFTFPAFSDEFSIVEKSSDKTIATVELGTESHILLNDTPYLLRRPPGDSKARSENILLPKIHIEHQAFLEVVQFLRAKMNEIERKSDKYPPNITLMLDDEAISQNIESLQLGGLSIVDAFQSLAEKADCRVRFDDHNVVFLPKVKAKVIDLDDSNSFQIDDTTYLLKKTTPPKTRQRADKIMIPAISLTDEKLEDVILFFEYLLKTLDPLHNSDPFMVIADLPEDQLQQNIAEICITDVSVSEVCLIIAEMTDTRVQFNESSIVFTSIKDE